MFSRPKSIPLNPELGKLAVGLLSSLVKQHGMSELSGEWRPTPMITSYGRTELRFSFERSGVSTSVAINGKIDFRIDAGGKVKLFSHEAKSHESDRVRSVLDEIQFSLDTALDTSGPSIKRPKNQEPSEL